MTTFRYGTGKGLSEPCSPYRKATFFGAELNSQNADGWNCLPVIVDPTGTFDLSTITKGREVVVALIAISETKAGYHLITFKWRRARDDKLLYSYSFDYTAVSGGWLYGYAFVGWIDKEINENGEYNVEITVSGVESFQRTVIFIVKGIPVEPIPPAPIDNFMAGIVHHLTAAQSWFIVAFREASGWVWPFNLLAAPLDWIRYSFGWLAYHFSNFSTWVSAITAKAATILSSFDIMELLKPVSQKVEMLVNWFSNLDFLIRQAITTWWASALLTVNTLINTAVQGIRTLVDNVNTELVKLKGQVAGMLEDLPNIDAVIAWWSNWSGQLLAFVNNWWDGKLLDVQRLINDTIKVWLPFYDSLEELWGSVAEFITNPLDWLESKFTSWFLGGE